MENLEIIESWDRLKKTIESAIEIERFNKLIAISKVKRLVKRIEKFGDVALLEEIKDYFEGNDYFGFEGLWDEVLNNKNIS